MRLHSALASLFVLGCATQQGVNSTPTPGEVTIGDFIFIGSGEFTMGSPTGRFESNESPAHRVSLSGFYIGAYEVTNLEYASFLTDSGGDAHWDYRMEIFKFGSQFRAVPGNEKLPVSHVTWRDAEAYCGWLGGRLPSEAEWEKAARGPQDQRLYPWGDFINSGEANFANPNGGLWEVGRAVGESFYSCYDMAGNVWEWAADWYDSLYYHHTPSSDPRGPGGGRERTIRGGSFLDDEFAARCARRYGMLPDARFVYLGFRCAIDSADYGNRRQIR